MWIGWDKLYSVICSLYFPSIWNIKCVIGDSLILYDQPLFHYAHSWFLPEIIIAVGAAIRWFSGFIILCIHWTFIARKITSHSFFPHSFTCRVARIFSLFYELSYAVINSHCDTCTPVWPVEASLSCLLSPLCLKPKKISRFKLYDFCLWSRVKTNQIFS